MSHDWEEEIEKIIILFELNLEMYLFQLLCFEISNPIAAVFLLNELMTFEFMTFNA